MVPVFHEKEEAGERSRDGQRVRAGGSTPAKHGKDRHKDQGTQESWFRSPKSPGDEVEEKNAQKRGDSGGKACGPFRYPVTGKTGQDDEPV